jgi:hypothetical protein
MGGERIFEIENVLQEVSQMLFYAPTNRSARSKNVRDMAVHGVVSEGLTKVVYVN